MGFNGLEGEELMSYLFGLIGQIKIEGEGLSYEEALEELLDMKIRDALEEGLHLE